MTSCNTTKVNYLDKDNKAEWLPMLFLLFLIILAIFIGIGIYISI